MPQVQHSLGGMRQESPGVPQQITSLSANRMLRRLDIPLPLHENALERGPWLMPPWL